MRRTPVILLLGVLLLSSGCASTHQEAGEIPEQQKLDAIDRAQMRGDTLDRQEFNEAANSRENTRPFW